MDVAVLEDDMELLEIKQNETENIYFDIEEKPVENDNDNDDDEDDDICREDPSRIQQQELISEIEEVEVEEEEVEEVEEEEVEEVEKVEEEVEEVEKVEEEVEKVEEEVEEVEKVEKVEEDKVEKVEEDKVEVELEEEVEEEEVVLEEMVINGKTYYVAGTENGAEVYEKTSDDDIGELLGTLKNGKIIKTKKA